MRGDRAGMMTTDFALAFTAEAVSLLRADGDGWLRLGSAAVGASDFAAQVAALRAAAADAAATPPEVALVLPVEHVLSGDLAADRPEDAEDALRKALQARGAPDAALLLWAIAPPAGQAPRRYCAALRETVDEAARYARAWGFEPTGACAPDAAGGAAPPAIPVPGRDERAAAAEEKEAGPVAAPPAIEPPAKVAVPPAKATIQTPEADAPVARTVVDERRRPESRRPPTTRRRRGAFAIWATLGAAVVALAALAWLVVPDPPSPSTDSIDAPPNTAAAPDPEPAVSPPSPLEIADESAAASHGGAAIDAMSPPHAAASPEGAPATPHGLPPRPEPPAIEAAPDAETTGEAGVAHVPAPAAQVGDETNPGVTPRDAAPTARAAVEIAAQPSAVVATLSPALDPPPEPAPERQAQPAAPPSSIDAASPRAETAPDTPPPAEAEANGAPPPAARPGEQADATPAADPVAPGDAPEAAPAEAAPPPPPTILPPLRPQSFATEAASRQAALLEAGPRPAPRPRDLAAAAAPAPSAERARTAPANAPRSIRTAATISDGLSEGLALIGVFGSSDGRRALIRGEDGAVRRVRRGDRIDGWSVAAIEADAIRLTAGGRSQTLRVPGR